MARVWVAGEAQGDRATREGKEGKGRERGYVRICAMMSLNRAVMSLDQTYKLDTFARAQLGRQGQTTPKVSIPVSEGFQAAWSDDSEHLKSGPTVA